MEYMDMLKEEYLKTIYTIPEKETILNEGFKNWLDEKERILPLYEQFLVAFDMTPSKGIIEVDKCEKDSVLPYTPVETKGFLVSENVKTKVLNKRGIININGRLIIIKDKKSYDIQIECQKKYIDVTNIKNFITQFPLTNETKNTMVDLMDIDKNVFIGTYGKLKEKNKDEKLKELYDLKQELCKYLNKNIDGEVVYTKEFYLAAITPKLKYKKSK